MVASLYHIRCLLLFFLLIQSVSLYKIHVSDNNHLDSSGSSVSEEIDEPIQNKNNEYDDDKDSSEEWETIVKRSVLSNGVPQRRNYRPHWNPLVAAYKRCGELQLRDERESCFKHAVQMLFVHKLRK